MRQYTMLYYLPGVGVGGRIRVCKKMFMATFDVKEKKIRVLAAKKVDGEGVCSEDGRKGNSSRLTISQEDHDFIEQHVLSFPAYQSHYCIAKSSKQYLAPDLNISKMYSLYEKHCKDNNRRQVHYNTYKRIFKTFNLGFKKPHDDCCNECDKLNNDLKMAHCSEKAQEIKLAQEKHQNAAKCVYTQKKLDVGKAKDSKHVCTASFDLQKCLATPYLRCGAAYYKRQLYTYN